MTINCCFVFRFKNKNTGELEQLLVDDEKSVYDAYNLARKNIIDKLDIDIRNFESEWSKEESKIAVRLYGMVPISDNEIEDRLDNIEGVNETDFIKSQESDKKQTIYYIDPEKSLNQDYILDNIRNLLDTLDIGRHYVNKDILVLIDPKYYSG